jgi:hypothetical protein
MSSVRRYKTFHELKASGSIHKLSPAQSKKAHDDFEQLIKALSKLKKKTPPQQVSKNGE